MGSEPIIILGQNRVLHEIRKSPKLPDTSGEMLWCLSPKTGHKVAAVIRAEAPFLALQKHKDLPGLLQSFRKT